MRDLWEAQVLVYQKFSKPDLIIGVKSAEQLNENLVVGDWDLPDEIWEEGNHQTALELGHLTQFASHAYRTAFGEEET